MKKLLTVFWLAVMTFALRAQTNIELFRTNQVVSITNKDGKVFKDIKIVTIKPNSFVYFLGDGLGGGTMNFKDLKDADKQRFGYDPAKAAAADSKELWRRIDDATAQQAARAAAVQANKEKAVRAIFAERTKFRFQVLQRINDGLLIKYSGQEGINGVSLLVDCPMEKSVVDGDYLEYAIYNIGNYSYTTVGGSKKTVSKWTTSLENAVQHALIHYDDK